MIKFISYILILLIISCSTAGFEETSDFDKRGLRDYVDMFVYDSKGKVTKKDVETLEVVLKKYPKDSTSIGICYPASNTITIKIDWWNKNTSSSKRKELLYHELGHCVLGLHHTKATNSKGFVGFIESVLFRIGFWEKKGYLKDGCPISIMYPDEVDRNCFPKHYDYYIAELFTNYEPKKEFIFFNEQPLNWGIFE